MAKLKILKSKKRVPKVEEPKVEATIEVEPGLFEPEFASSAPVQAEQSKVEPVKLSPRDILRTEEVVINGKVYKKNFRVDGTTDLN